MLVSNGVMNGYVMIVDTVGQKRRNDMKIVVVMKQGAIRIIDIRNKQSVNTSFGDYVVASFPYIENTRPQIDEDAIEKAILSLKTAHCSNPDCDREGTPTNRCGGCWDCINDQFIDAQYKNMTKEILTLLNGKDK